MKVWVSFKRVHSGNGGEYLSNNFWDLFIQNSIKHEFTSPYSPRQNGTAERNWRTLFDMARSMLQESNLPKYLWTYAAMDTTYV